MTQSQFWTKRRVCLTGGAGFLGSYVKSRLEQYGCESVYIPRSSEFDLRDKNAINRMYDAARPDIVIHLAAVVGGIGANRENPGKYFYDNLIMGVELIEQARQFQIPKLVAVGTI